MVSELHEALTLIVAPISGPESQTMPDSSLPLISKNSNIEMRINQQVTIILHRPSAPFIEVYRRGVLVWQVK